MLNDLTLSRKKNLNLQIVLSILILFIGDLLYKLIYDISIFKVIFQFLNYSFFLFLISIIFLGLLHEFFHLISYMLFGKANFKDISIGFDFKTLYFYTDCTKFLTASTYIWILLFPMLILGIFPYFIGITIENVYLATLGLALIASSSADILYLIYLKNIPSKSLLKTSKEFDGFIIKT